MGDNPIFTFTVFVCPHDYATVVIMFYSFCFNKMPSKTFRMAYDDSCVKSCWKSETFAPSKLVLIIHTNVILIWFLLIWIGTHIYQVFLIYQDFWSYRSIRELQITTDCSVFDRFCFLRVVCLFWWIYGQFGGMNHGKVGIQ